MDRTATTIAATLTALTLAGCSANSTQAHDPARPTETQPSASMRATDHIDPASSPETIISPDTEVETDGPFAAETLGHLLTTLTTVYQDNAGHENYVEDCDVPLETLEEHQVCSPSDPIGHLDSIESPRDGVLVVTLLPEAWGGGEYDPDRVFTVPYLAEILHGYIGRHTDGPLEVTTITPDGEYQATQGFVPDPDDTNTPQTEAELEDWADERFEDWLRAMNFTYQGLCGGVESVMDYRQCVPDDPHGYITSFEAPTYGELVVHVENGAWQGGQYEPAATFMAGNILLKIGSYSNEVATLTVVTEDGQSETVEFDPHSGTYY